MWGLACFDAPAETRGVITGLINREDKERSGHHGH
jgi:hypothetical protein